MFITGTHDMMGTDRLEILAEAGKIVVHDSRLATIHRLKKPMQEYSATMDAAAIQRLVRQELDWSRVPHHGTHRRALPVRHRPTAVLENFARAILYDEPLLAPAAEGMARFGCPTPSPVGLAGREVPYAFDDDVFLAELNPRIRRGRGIPSAPERDVPGRLGRSADLIRCATASNIVISVTAGSGGGADQDSVGPGIVEFDRAAVVVGLDAVEGEAVGHAAEFVGGGHLDPDQAETQTQSASPGSVALPGVHRHVVVVAACADEQGRVAELGCGLEAELVDVELPGRGDVADAQMNVSDGGRTRRCRGHGCWVEMIAQEPVRVEHQRGHLYLAMGPAPGRLVAVGVQLDPIALRVGEVEGPD